MLPPSFQVTLNAVEGEMRRGQSLLKTTWQAAFLEDEDVAYTQPPSWQIPASRRYC